MYGGIKELIHILHKSPATPLFLLRTKHGEKFHVHEDSIFLAPHLKEIFLKHADKKLSYTNTIHLRDIEVLPDLRVALEIPRNGDFSNFLHNHQIIASKLTELFMSIDLLDLVSVIAYVRDRINSKLFFYSLAVALAHRPDTNDLKINVLKAFPSDFIPSEALIQAKERRSVGIYSSPLKPITISETGTFIDEEYRVAYFREDIAVNSHHWYWHIVYAGVGKKEIVNKDRRGELFFYMHQQMMGRYNTERLSAHLARVVPFDNFREVIPQGYFSKLVSQNSSRDISGRAENLTWQDLNRVADRIVINIGDMVSYRMRIEQAIDAGLVVVGSEKVSPVKGSSTLTHEDLTIDMLGNMVESSMLSPNPSVYGNLHGFGHVVTAYVHDPKRKYMENMGVMGDTATAVRDPFFFRWHGLIDQIFQRFKSSKMCPPYEHNDLVYEDIEVANVKIFLNVWPPHKKEIAYDELHTLWKHSIIKVDGLDFETEKPIHIKFKHLDHVPFAYKIDVNNSRYRCKGTVRIFLAPTLDENGASFKLKEQRHLFLEMDRFVVDLKHGPNQIIRKSTDSSITIPLEQSFPESLVTNEEQNFNDIYCKCGWPQHMLVPKGKIGGAKFKLFVMVSDYEKDKVVISSSGKCKESSSFCGLKDSRYPDARSMGYPFDRVINEEEYIYINDFITKNTNMIVKDVLVKHFDINDDASIQYDDETDKVLRTRID